MAKKKQTFQEPSPFSVHMENIRQANSIIKDQSVSQAASLLKTSTYDILKMVKGEINNNGYWTKAQPVPYVLHALLFVLRQKHPYAFVEEIWNLKYLKEALNVAKKLPKPENSAVYRERIKTITNPMLIQCLEITAFVADNWDLAHSQLEQWSKAIEENENKIVTTKSIKWEKLLEKHPIDEYRRGELLSQEQLAECFGITVPYLAHKKSTIVKRIKGTKAEKEFKEWFVVGETRGNPSKLRAEYFPAYAFLIESISLPTDKKEKRRTTMNKNKECVDVAEKCDIYAEIPLFGNEKMEYIEELPEIVGGEDEGVDKPVARPLFDHKKRARRHIGMSCVKAINYELDQLTKDCEAAMQNLIDAEIAYNQKQSEIGKTLISSARTQLISELSVANQNIVDAEQKLDKLSKQESVARASAEPLIQQRTQIYQGIQHAKKDLADVDAKIVQLASSIRKRTI